MLPKDVAPHIDWEALTQLPDSFVDHDLSWRHSDLLFRAPLAGQNVFIYLLVEHQSSADRLMPFRMLRYVTRVWDKYLIEHPSAKALPVVFPLVVYHGARGWTAPTTVRELIDAPLEVIDALGDHVPGFRFALDDLTRTDLHALRERALSPAVLVTFVLLQTALGNPRIAQEFTRLATQVPGLGDLSVEDMLAFLTYIRAVGDSAPDALQHAAEQLGPAIQEAYMTTQEQLINRGRAQGRTEGRAEGRTEGRAEGRAESLVELLTVKFGTVNPEQHARIREASSSTLTTWMSRIFDADTIENVLN